jgi:hypothetical protein
MADYTSYSIVSWTDATPITSVRLNQMSTNIEQVRTVNDDKPKGLLKISNTIITSGSAAAGGNYANAKIVALTLNGAVDDRVTLDSTRRYRLVFNLSGITQNGPGNEDGYYLIKFCKGNTTSTGNTIQSYTIGSGVGAYINTAAAVANIDNIALTSGINFGGGVYSVIYTNNTVNESFFIEIERKSGSSTTNASSWSITDWVQFYIEDVGGVA